MALLPICNPIKENFEWKNYVKRAETELTQADAVYKDLSQEDHPGCQVVIGYDDAGSVTRTGYVECGAKLVRRVTGVE